MKKTNIKLIFLGAIVFFLASCSSSNSDPLESYNRSMYNVNKAIDKYTFKPIAKAYKAITPDIAEKGVNNFFNNISEIGTMINSLLQGKFHNTAVSSARIVWNTSFGLGGLLDVATPMGLNSDDEDFGQTLQTWGVPKGPYIVLPILGPSTLTDIVGRAGDYFTNPVNYGGYEKDTRVGLKALDAVNQRVQFLPLEEAINNAPGDEYSFVKSAYLQRRSFLVNDGKSDDSIDDEINNLLDEK